jgi:hypothetical protein
LTITNSTIADNDSSLSGIGGVYNESAATLTVSNSTISNNVGGGIWNQGIATITSSIISGNSAVVGGENCIGSITDGGYNLDDGTTCGFNAVNHSLSNTNPSLDPAGITDNGGPTQTIALIAGSPAIDAIPPGVNDCGTTITADQRGVTRPQGAACDVRAFEVEQQTPAQLLAALGEAVVGVGPGTSLADKVTRAIAYLNANDIPDTCSTLGAFINQVKAQTGKTIPASEAATLTADALQIKTLLGC